jgi:hypothetical protein
MTLINSFNLNQEENKENEEDKNKKEKYGGSNNTSYTRLSSFPKCPTRFYYQYIKKLSEGLIEVLDESLLVGKLVHSCIELELSGLTKEEALRTAIPLWLDQDCSLSTTTWQDSEELFEPEYLSLPTEPIIKYATAAGKIYRRCAANYNELDQIRNGDGSVPKDPINYPPTPVKKALGELYTVAQDINNLATQINPQFVYLNLATILGRAAFYFENFLIPPWVAETIGVELRFDDLGLKSKHQKTWTGGIDWIFRTTDGALVICDHKTEKECKEGIDVLHHPQLNLYVHLYYEYSQQLADLIAIYHLPSSTIVLAEVDPNIVRQSVEALGLIEDEIAYAISENKWRKPLSPSDFGSPCMRRDWKTKNLASVCKFFRHCWPDYTSQIENELPKP